MDIQNRMKIFSITGLKNKINEKGIVYCISKGFLYFFIKYPIMVLKSLSLWIDNITLWIDKITLPIRKKIWMGVDSTKYRINKKIDTLYAFYDLAGSPATFDIITFLVLADYTRVQKKCNQLHVLIIPGPDAGFRPNDLKAYQELSIDQKNADTAFMEWRLRNILLPVCWLIPSCKGITVCTSRDEALAFEVSFIEHRFPENYSVRYPTHNHHMTDIIMLAKNGISFPSISSTEQALKFIKEWLGIHAGNRKTIVITLRESSYELYRNNNLDNWGKFVQSLDMSIFCPVIIRDTEKAFEPLPSGFENVITFPEVCFNIELRSALYELCYLNMTVDHGPLELCLFNKKTKFISFKWGLTPGAKTHMKFLNIEPGSQPSICSPFQKWVWEDDTFEVLQREFHEMYEKIENSIKTLE